MSHDSESAFASSEIAEIIQTKASNFFGTFTAGGTWSISAGREGSTRWPLADGLIQAVNSKQTEKQIINIAFEYKRPNEGVHGILTAVGQSLAYIEKGYDASVICIPSIYTSHSNPGTHVKKIIDTTAPKSPITVYVYDTPNMAQTRPFKDKIQCIRDIDLSTTTVHREPSSGKISSQISTIWAHVREGMSHPDAFFKYCQGVKIISSIGEKKEKYILPQEIINAIHRKEPSADPINYLSSTTGDTMSDRAWRTVWFNYYFWKDLIPIYKSTSPYIVNDVPTKIKKSETEFQKIFSGRVDSLKNKLINKLNTDSTYTEEMAWDEYVVRVRNDAHSYREVIDSGLYQIGLIDADGLLTDYGYKYVNACEKSNNNPYAEEPMNILRAVSLQIGQFDVFLSTAYKYSQEKFHDNFDSFTIRKSNGDVEIKNEEYLIWLDSILTDQLHMYKKTTLRAGGTRKPFQAEMAYLKKLGFIYSGDSIKRGIGLNIDWPLVQESLIYFQNL
jgi:hypothetical protein